METTGFFDSLCMRRKNISFRFAFACFVCIAAVVAVLFAIGVLFPSCSAALFDRTVELEIPQHPWEACSNDVEMWYSVKWSYGNEVRSLYVPPGERRASIKVPIGETVFICAFPLGEMRPFGAVVTPFDSDASFVMSQEDGYIAALLMDVDRDSTKGINYRALKEVLKSVGKESSSSASTADSVGVLALDKVRFLRDVMNGELSQSSVVFLKPFDMPQFAIPNGVWVSESALGSYYIVKDSMMPSIRLSEGVHRFYNPSTDRELVVVVDEKGNTFRYVRQALV